MKLFSLSVENKEIYLVIDCTNWFCCALMIATTNNNNEQPANSRQHHPDKKNKCNNGIYDKRATKLKAKKRKL